MDAILSFVAAHWVQWLFAFATAALAWLYKNIAAQVKTEQARNEAIAAGVQSLLRENIVDNFNKYTERGFCPIYAKDSIKRVYKAYADLGGNDVASELYHKLLQMRETPDND